MHKAWKFKRRQMRLCRITLWVSVQEGKKAGNLMELKKSVCSSLVFPELNIKDSTAG